MTLDELIAALQAARTSDAVGALPVLTEEVQVGGWAGKPTGAEVIADGGPYLDRRCVLIRTDDPWR